MSESQSLFELSGLTAMITGAGSGIGKGIAQLYVERGAKVIIADRDEATAQATAAELKATAKNTADAMAIVCDVSDEASVKAAFDTAEAAFGTVDILVNNAGIYYLRPFLEITVDDWEQVFTVNVRGLFLCMREAILRLKKAGRGGSIVNISSVNSQKALIFDNIHYTATKAAVNGITAASALEFAEDDIRINAILPGSVVTEGTAKLRSDSPRRGPILNPERMPLNRRGEPVDIAAAAVYLASPAASYVTGQLLAVDGGFQIS